MRLRALLAALSLATAALLAVTTPATPAASAATATVHPAPGDDGPHPPLITRRQAPAVHPHALRPATVQALPNGAYEITGLDLHDSMVTHLPDGRYAMYGSLYGCGYQWYVVGSPWCGFGVSTAPSLAGPWTAPDRLFDPASTDPWSGLTWAAECGTETGQGCFNPRMIIRSGWGADDAVPILWFNSPIDYSRSHANAYDVMGCASPTGPCGPDVSPHGSYNKPSLSICSGNGDFSIITSGSLGGRPAIVCTMPGAASLSIEELNYSGSGGDGTGVRSVAGVSSIEGPGGWYDPSTNAYWLTYSDPGCGYCAGTGTGYATSSGLYSGWSAPVSLGFGPPATGRRLLSGTSCGGQPRTVSVVDGQAWQVIDLWTGARNETSAGTLLAPLTTGPAQGIAGDGQRWTPPLSLAC